MLGAWIFARIARLVHDEKAVRSLALDLPLMRLVYRLVQRRDLLAPMHHESRSLALPARPPTHGRMTLGPASTI